MKCILLKTAVAVVFVMVSARVGLSQDAKTATVRNLCLEEGVGPDVPQSRPNHPPIMTRGWLPGWEMCDGAIAKYDAEKRASDAANEATNPDLKTARDAARALGLIPSK